MIYGRVDQVYRTNDVVVVVESLDEMTQPLSGIRCQVIHVIEFFLDEESVDERMIEDGALNEATSIRNVFSEPAAQVVENDYTVTIADQVLSDMRANESRAAGHE